MHTRLLTVFLGVTAALLVLGATATGTQPGKPPRKKPVPVELSQALWATINVCDTEEKKNTIGIRGSMPGLGDRPAKLQMRFQVQYQAAADGMWHNSDQTADSDSGWRTVGRRVKTKVIESGWNFTFKPPTDGGAHVLRGSVRFKWLRKGKVVQRSRRFTEGGHLSTAGADPEGYSAAICRITQP